MEQTKKTWIDYYKKFGIYIFLAAVFIFFAAAAPNFLSYKNIINILRQVSMFGIVDGCGRNDSGILYGKYEYGNCAGNCHWHFHRLSFRFFKWSGGRKAACGSDYCDTVHDACAAGRGLSDHRRISDHRNA